MQPPNTSSVAALPIVSVIRRYEPQLIITTFPKIGNDLKVQAKKLVIRADASPQMGTGHVMRMLALAKAWQCRGGSVTYVSAFLPDSILNRLREACIDVQMLDSISNPADFLIGSDDDARDTALIAESCQAEWIVADGYAFDPKFQMAVRKSGVKLAIIADSNCFDQWCCDLLLNQNPHALSEAYRSSVKYCRFLLGTRYALLREEFGELQLAASESTRGDERLRILVTLGGSDADNATGSIVEKLESLSDQSISLRVLIGAANPNRAALHALLARSRHDAEMLTNVSNMPEQYKWADAVISAGGSSCWEWIYFGLPAAIVVIAENQRPIYDTLVQDGIAVGLGETATLLGSSATERLAEFVEQLRMKRSDPLRYRHIVDGFGAQRFAAALDSGMWLRRATHDDRELYYHWAQDPAVRANSLNSDPIPWDSHCDWFAKQLARGDTVMLVAMREETAVGQIRFSQTEHHEWNVAFSVDSESRGRGTGRQLLMLGTQWMFHHRLSPLIATVKVGNDASANCFRRLNWESIPSNDSTLFRFRKSQSLSGNER
ncbi:MAG: UDP-2,4-diacetamido-2,4,6-trideoxy-beta-L-altropyranose hydrolase [Pirellulaceae bacterium]